MFLITSRQTVVFIKTRIGGGFKTKMFSSFQAQLLSLFLLLVTALPALACGNCNSNCCTSDCSVNKYKCADESPLCARLEALCDNFFFNQWKDMRCACAKTCKLCTDQGPVEQPELPAVPPMPVQQDPARCDPTTNPIDVVLVLDGSASITRDLFDRQILGFAKSFAQQLNVSPDGHCLGVVQYSSVARTEIALGAYNTTSSLQSAIDNIRYQGQGTRTGMAINWAQQNAFDFSRNVTKACIVLTDGVSSDQVKGPADRLRQRGVHMIAIGVGRDFNRAELDQIANEPSHVYTVDNFQNLNTIVESLSTRICRDASA